MFLFQTEASPTMNNKQKNVFLRVESLNYDRDLTLTPEGLVICVGPRKTYFYHDHNIGDGNNTKSYNKVWNYKYLNSNHSTFVIAIYRAGKINPGYELADIELKLNAFQPNNVTRHSFMLRQKDRNMKPFQITLSIHLSEDGKTEFDAPICHKIRDDYEVIHPNN